MIAQMKWYEILKPTKSMLKFRLPYIGDKLDRKVKMDYLEGDIYFQIWPAGSSSECRLVVGKNAKIKQYDSIKYENQLFRFNQVERVLCYEHQLQVPGIDHCYDCRAEVFVFEEYIKISEKLKRFAKEKIVIKQTVKEYIQDLNEFLGARFKTIRITKDGKHYDLKFTDVEYGKGFEELCNERTETRKARRTYLNKNYSFNKRLIEQNVDDSRKEENHCKMNYSFKKYQSQSNWNNRDVTRSEHVKNRLGKKY